MNSTQPPLAWQAYSLRRYKFCIWVFLFQKASWSEVTVSLPFESLLGDLGEMLCLKELCLQVPFACLIVPSFFLWRRQKKNFYIFSLCLSDLNFSICATGVRWENFLFLSIVKQSTRYGLLCTGRINYFTSAEWDVAIFWGRGITHLGITYNTGIHFV